MRPFCVGKSSQASGPSHIGPVGIIGAGHLGRALAQLLLRHGLASVQLMVSHNGSAATAGSLRSMGLLHRSRGNEEIARDANTIFLALPPRAAVDLGKLRPKANRTLSCMAGVSMSRLHALLQCPVTRIMPSGPETIVHGCGVVATFPPDAYVTALLAGLGMRVFELAREELLHWFTVGVSLPAALLAAPAGAAAEQAIAAIGEDVPFFAELFAWARAVVPTSLCLSQRQQYIEAMCTAGGVTEAIVAGLRSGNTLLDSLILGCKRSQSLA